MIDSHFNYMMVLVAKLLYNQLCLSFYPLAIRHTTQYIYITFSVRLSIPNFDGSMHINVVIHVFKHSIIKEFPYKYINISIFGHL